MRATRTILVLLLLLAAIILIVLATPGGENRTGRYKPVGEIMKKNKDMVTAIMQRDPDPIISHHITATNAIHHDVVRLGSGVVIYAGLLYGGFHIIRIEGDKARCSICHEVTIMHATAEECRALPGHQSGQMIGGDAHCKIGQTIKIADRDNAMVRVPLTLSRRIADLW